MTNRLYTYCAQHFLSDSIEKSMKHTLIISNSFLFLSEQGKEVLPKNKASSVNCTVIMLCLAAF